MIKVILLAALLTFESPAEAKTKIKLLTWWDYISSETIDELKKIGLAPEIVFYKSTESAIARIANPRDDFDAAILSGHAIALLNDKKLLHDQDLLTPLGRNYHKFTSEFKNCLPYQWSTSVFMVNSDQKEKVEHLEDLVLLKNKNYRIGILDDSMEMFTRIMLDNQFQTVGEIDEMLFRKKYGLLRAADFSSAISSFIREKNTASYGWSGEVRDVLRGGLNISFHLAKHKPVVGTDYVCITYRGKDAERLKLLKRFVIELTNHKNSSFNTKFNQYFSPYVEQTKELLPAYRNLQRAVLDEVRKGNYHIVRFPSPEEIAASNKIWRKVRFH